MGLVLEERIVKPEHRKKTEMLVIGQDYKSLRINFCCEILARKAMKTLDIATQQEESFVPTITNVFKSIMKEAKREHEVSSCVLYLI